MEASIGDKFVRWQAKIYGDRFRMLTVPELKDKLKKRKIGNLTKGKKSKMLTRLLIWV
jgi:hypothetical protein